MRLAAVAIAAGLGIGACTVSTVGGPVWPEQRLVGPEVATACLDGYAVTIAGAEPWLEHEARRLWLERLATQRRCRYGGDRHRGRRVFLDVRDLQASVKRDLYGAPTRAGKLPPGARAAVALGGTAEFTRCDDGEVVSLPLDRQAWVPDTNDPFLLEERALAVLPELIDAQLSGVLALVQAAACVAGEAVAAAAVSAPAGAAAAAAAPTTAPTAATGATP